MGLPSLVASAATMPLGSPADVTFGDPLFSQSASGKDWQHEAYRHYKRVGEARYAVRFISRAAGRVKLSGSTPAAQEALDLLFSGPMSQSDFIESMFLHMFVGGEGYLIGRAPTPTEQRAYPGMGSVLWEVVGIPEISNTGTSFQINHGGTAAPIMLSKSDAAIRIWLKDPEAAFEADSPFLSLQTPLREIEKLDNRMDAILSSRMIGNGVLAVPESWELPAAPGESPSPSNRATSFMRMLAAVASKAIADRESPSAKLPIVVTKPDGSTESMEWQTFWSELDEVTMPLREAAVRRVALGVDLPPEQVLGMGGQAQGQHTGTGRQVLWAIEESTITMHIEPILKLIVDALERHFVRPITGDPEAHIEQDTTKLRLRPDRSKESLELYDRGLIGGDTVVKENGFRVEDEPTKDEIKSFILRRIAAGSATPDQVAAAAKQLGVDLPGATDSGGDRPAPQNPATQVQDEKTQAMLDAPSPRPDPVPSPVSASAAVAHEDPDKALSAEFVISCEATVLRTLERVGSKLIRINGDKAPVTGVAATEAHVTLSPNKHADLDGLFGGPDVFGLTLLGPVSDKPRELLGYLNEFAESLVHSRKAYSRDAMVKALEDGEFRG